MLLFNNKTPKKINFNGKHVAKVIFNSVVVWLEKVLTTITGYPITLTNSTGDDLVDYKIYGNSVQGRLPDEYQEVEYIESTGTQYIDTKYVPNKDTEIKANVAFMEKTDILQQFGVITNLGISGKAKYSRRHFGVFENMLTCFKTTLSSGGDVRLTYNNNFHEYYLSNTTAKIDDTSATPATTSNSNVTFTLFARNSYTNTGGSAKISNYAKAKLKTFKIYENSILIMDLVPCYRKSDNIIGLYDTVNDVFYTNAGTGTFTKGNDIKPTPDNPIEVESVGDLVTDENDENYGKYKIPIKVNNIITNIYLDEPLRKFKEYTDYIDFGKQKVVRNVVEGILDGSEGWSSSVKRYYYYNTNLNIKCLGNGVAGIKSNALPSRTWNEIRNSGTGIATYTNGVVHNRIDIRADNIWSTVDEAKEYLANNPIQYIGPALNPTEETLDLPVISTNAGTNIIEVDTSIAPSNMEVEYYSKNI